MAAPPVPLVLVVDTGVDDALAIVAAARSATLRLAGVVTAAGNTSLERATANTILVLDLLGARVPVAVGTGTRLDGTPLPVRPEHGKDGLAGLAGLARHTDLSDDAGPSGPARPGRLAEVLAAAHGGVLLCCAPLTTLASALREDPGALAGIRPVATAARPGEPNERMDPPAAREVDAAVTLTHHGLDRFAATTPAPRSLPGVPPEDPVARLVSALLAAQRARGAGLGDAGAVLDLAAGTEPRTQCER